VVALFVAIGVSVYALGYSKITAHDELCECQLELAPANISRCVPVH
jgi:hypothetical protein